MITNNLNTFIYTLSCPITNEIKYIGKSDNPKKRLTKHLSEKKSTLKNNWIKSLKKNGLKPKMEILDEVLKEEWKFWEIYWIEQFKVWGFYLKNSTIGGEGGDIFNSLSEDKKKDIKRKISIRMSNRIVSKQTKNKLSEIAKNRTYSKKTKEKFKQSKLGKFGKLHNGSKEIFQYDIEEKFIKKFDSLSDVFRETGIHISNISKVCNGFRKTAGGYVWKYKLKKNKK
jgi:group I intron endonuclease